MKVLSYSENTLAQELTNDYTPLEVIKIKNQFHYLNEYLGDQGLKIKTLVVEEHYVSKDYLKDFSSYYVSCFKPYNKHCKRLHFFSNSFTQEELKKQLISTSEKSKAFWEHYNGFITVKPIPITVIGTSVLKTYTKGKLIGDRNFWGTRNYKIHLWGKEIILDSLAFQEQDTVLSACATTAIWSVLHKASEDYSIVLKTPGEITKEAGKIVPNTGRLLPNKEGLEISQMCQAIESVGLEVEIRLPIIGQKYIANKYIKKILNAYAPIGTPIILIIKVPSGYIDRSLPIKKQIDNIKYGLHAITVTGFKQKSLKTLNKEIRTASVYKLIDKIYAHDDQWGAFARSEFINDYELSTPWTKFHDSKLTPPSYTEGIIIPVFSKLRISYDDIEPIAVGIAEIYKHVFNGILKSGIVWDLKVMYSEDYKEEIKKSSDLNEQTKLKVLTSSLPKFIWIVSNYSQEIRISDFLFDATDISNGMNGIDVIFYFPELQIHLHKYLKANKEFSRFVDHKLKSQYFDFLLKEI